MTFLYEKFSERKVRGSTQPYFFFPQRKSTAGFTLVETLVAVIILVLAILGPMSIAITGIQNALFANERITATYLAQEAIESFVKLRNENALDVLYGGGTSSWWWYEEPGNSNPIHHCKIDSCDYDVVNRDYIHCSGPTTCTLDFDEDADDGYYYLYGSGLSSSLYTREIEVGGHDIDSDGDYDAAEITVTVTWSPSLFSGSDRSVILTTWLYDQYNRYEPNP